MSDGVEICKTYGH